MGYLDKDGVLYLWNKIKSGFVAKDGNKVLSTNDFTNDHKTKLEGIDVATADKDGLVPSYIMNMHLNDGGLATNNELAIQMGLLQAVYLQKADAKDLYDPKGAAGTAKAEAITAIEGYLGSYYESTAQAEAKYATLSHLSNTYAKKTDIAQMYKYKGSVATADKLPTSGQTIGDVYNIEAASTYGSAGANVAWNGSAWDSLGEIFEITSITNTEIDNICK